jgi:A/G-specific adenine glycosylase
LKSELFLAPEFTSALLSWYDANRRDLPWRDHPDPYAVLVSEFMLQQTTVAAVIPYFKNWMKVYPTVKDLSDAEPSQVLRSWEGLGYYSRARNLHAASREITSKYQGRIPSDPHDLRKLPGIGAYTAAAVASIAYGLRVPALDANNLRVWSRLLATSDRKRITKIFTRVLPQNRAGDFNQALMDLGTSICTPGDPHCLDCPLAAWCRAWSKGTVSEFPLRKPRPDTTRIEAAIGIIVREGKILVQKRPEIGLMAGLWEFPGGKLKKPSGEGEGEHGSMGEKTRNRDKRKNDLSPMRPCARAPKLDTPTLPSSHAPMHPDETPEEAVVREVREETGLRIQVCEKLGVFSHSYTRFRVKLHVFMCRRKAGMVHNPTARWVTLEELEGLAMPSVNRRVVKRLEERLKNGCDD